MKAGELQRYDQRLLGWYAIYRTQTAQWLRSIKTKQPGTYSKRTKKKEHSDVAHEVSKLKEAVEDTGRILAKASTIFRLFPDTITIDRQKLTIIYRHFFKSQNISVPLENIKNIQADYGMFLGSLTVTSDLFVNNTQSIHGLSRGDVRTIQQIVHGLATVTNEDIDISKIKTKQLRELLCRLGESR